MCGIIATYDPHGEVRLKSDELKTRINAGLSYIAHRGPDANGFWINQDVTCGLGHCRLAINDLTPDGEQPLHSPDGKVHAVVNGEIYDYDTIREQITSVSNYPFKGHSDSELVVALYLIYGRSFLHHLRGEFSLVIYDERSSTFLAARDRYGIKPLFWTRHEGRILIAAEVKAFLGMGWKAEWDVGSILDGGWGQDTRTIFKGVQKLRPGHYMSVQPGGEPEIRRYWNAEYSDKASVSSYLQHKPEADALQRVSDPRSEADIIAETRRLLLESVRIRLRADVPVGIYLSGGIDSSAVAGMAAHLVQTEGLSMGSEAVGEEGRVCCFSIGFDESSGFDESTIAERTANHLGVRFLKKHMDENELANRFEDAVYHIEHHNHDLNFVGKYALSEVPRQHGYKVVLTGEGADEHFAGYPLYLPDYLREEDQAMKSGLDWTPDQRAKTTGEQDGVIKEMYRTIGASDKYFENNSLATQLNGISTPASMLAFTPPLAVFSAGVQERYAAANPLETVANNVDEVTKSKIQDKWHPLHSAMYTWGKGHLTNQFLSCLGDRVEMAHSVEARTPFLDHKLTEYINGLPPSMKLRYAPTGPGNPDPRDLKADFVEKYVLREATKEFITPEIYTRRKHPYSAPTTYPVDGPVHKLLVRLVTKQNVAQLGFLDWAEVEALLHAAFGDGPADDKTAAFRLSLVIAEWIVLAQRFDMAPVEL